MKKHIITALAVSALIAGAATTANATNPETCVPAPAYWTEPVWNTWTGGPLSDGVTPPHDSPYWNPNSGNPQSPNHRLENHTINTPYWVSHGGSGKADWFLWTSTRVPPVTCPDSDPEPSGSPSPSPDPQVTITPDPDPEQCPPGTVPGAPDEDGNFVCQNDDPAPEEPVVEEHDESSAPAPAARAVTSDATFTG